MALRHLLLGCIVFGALACSKKPTPTPTPTPTPAATDIAPLRSEAKVVLEKHCGLCHREDSPQAKKLALAVFNLNAGDSFASMSADRLRSARRRLADAPTGGDPASPEDVARFDAFMQAELARRD
jgi:hypothetical protein